MFWLKLPTWLRLLLIYLGFSVAMISTGLTYGWPPGRTVVLALTVGLGVVGYLAWLVSRE